MTSREERLAGRAAGPARTRRDLPALPGSLLAVAIALLVAACGPEHRTTYCYGQVALDMAALTLRPIQPLGPECPRDSTSSYWRLTDVRGRHHINHVGPLLETPAGHRRVHYNQFTASPDHVLTYRTKEHLLLDGTYGRVYARTIYYYASTYGRQPASFEVRSYLTDLPSEPPQEVASLPPHLPLDAISLVRVFRHAPGFLVISADYRPTGELATLHINGTRDGEWTNLPEDSKAAGAELGVSTRRWTSAQLAAFGIPERFVMPKSLERRPSGKYVPHLGVVHLHYARNRWVVQHVFESGSRPASRVLTFSVTPEDAALEAIDASRPFGNRREKDGATNPGGIRALRARS